MYSAATRAMNSPFDQQPPQTHPGRAYDHSADSSERTYALFTHLVGLVSLSNGGIPLLGLIGTIIMWRIKAEQSPFLDDHGREATNFQLSLILYTVLGIAFMIVTFGIGALLAVPGMIAMIALSIVGQVRGAMAAHRGEYYRYPCCVRFIKAPDDL